MTPGRHARGGRGARMTGSGLSDFRELHAAHRTMRLPFRYCAR
jgi:hypothetical protein